MRLQETLFPGMKLKYIESFINFKPNPFYGKSDFIEFYLLILF